jgi:hypothetical protein
MVEFEAVRQPSETIAENSDLAVNAGKKLLGGRTTSRHRNTYAFIVSMLP